VTGADGFIGRALVAHFAQSKRPLRAIVHREPPPSASPREVVRAADLTTASDALLDELVADSFAIVHLAGRAHVLRDTADDPAAAYRSANTMMTVRLAQAALRARVGRFVLASTIKVNGEASAPSRPFRPEDAPDPADHYARSKLDAERDLVSLCAGTATAAIVLRLPLVYGPGVKGNFATLLDEIARERPLPLGAIRNRRSLVFVGNVIEAIDAALEASPPPSGVHFITDNESISVRDLASAIAAALSVPIQLTSVPVSLLRIGGRIAGKGAIVDRLVSTLEGDGTSFTLATGWRPRHSLHEGLATTAAWWRMRHSI
jgi:UDP-glucose 4-epimerase